jgi:hypothetical protein
VWHVFQQNESLRLDLKSGNFYETKADGTKVNRFHLSAVANIERQAGGDTRRASEAVADFLDQRKLAAPGVIGSRPRNVPQPAPVARQTDVSAAQTAQTVRRQGGGFNQFGSTVKFG